MKRSQRNLLNRVTEAIEKGRKKGLLQTTGSIYQKYAHEGVSESSEYACAYGALAAGLDIDIVPDPTEGMSDEYLHNIRTQVNEKLGVDEECGTLLYPTIYLANDSSRAGSDRDAYVIEILKDKLENNPEFCADEE